MAYSNRAALPRTDRCSGDLGREITGVWGALGTRAGKEIIPSEREAAYRTLH